VDEALYDVGDIYSVPEEKAKKLRESAVRYAFRHYYETSRFYRRYCEKRSVTPDDVRTEEDFGRIPLIPSGFLLEHPADTKGIVKWMNAFYAGDLSEVTGKSMGEIIGNYKKKGVEISISPQRQSGFTITARDAASCQRWLYLLGSALIHTGIEQGTHVFAALNEHTPDNPMASSIIIEASRILTDDVWCARKDMGIKEVVNRLEKSEDKPVFLCSTPEVFSALVSYAEKRGKGIRLPDGSHAAILGWDDWNGVLDDSLIADVKRHTGIQPVSLFAPDVSSALFPICDHGYAHVPSSIVGVMALDDEMSPVGYGEEGSLAMLGTLNDVWPGFVVTEDRVKILKHCPECDLPGPVVEHVRGREERAEDRGCAAVVESLLRQAGTGT
jgi:hypothetical protein